MRAFARVAPLGVFVCCAIACGAPQSAEPRADEGPSATVTTETTTETATTETTTTTTEPTTETSAETTTTETETTARAPGACPARFGGRPAPSCDAADAPSACSYPEGNCWCGRPVWCGGAAPPPMPPTWQCERAQPPCGEEGAPCDGTRSCTIDRCGFDRMVCVGGRWQAQIGERPP